MKINLCGITRIVIELKTVVIKIPNFLYQWDHFLKGILANIHEYAIFKNSEKKDLLCPIIWCSWGGWILVMKKARVLTDEEYLDMDLTPFLEFGLINDNKSDAFGYIENKIVKIDYGQ